MAVWMEYLGSSRKYTDITPLHLLAFLNRNLIDWFSCRTVLIANNVSLLNKEDNAPIYSVEDVKNIKEIATRDDAFDLLSDSLAPSIYGHSWIKKAVVLLMLSGVEKNLKNDTHLRGLEFSLDLLSVSFFVNSFFVSWSWYYWNPSWSKHVLRMHWYGRENEVDMD